MPQMIIPDPNTLATPSSPGAESAANNVKLASLAAGGWYDQQIASMTLGAPGVSAFRYTDYHDPVHLLRSGVADAVENGGGITVTSGGAMFPLTQKFALLPKTQVWSLRMLATLPVPVAGQSCDLGVRDTSGSSYGCYFYIDNSVSTTKISCFMNAAGGSSLVTTAINSDGLPHLLGIDADLTNVKFSIDGVVVSTVAISTNKLTASSIRASCSTNTCSISISDLAIGY